MRPNRPASNRRSGDRPQRDGARPGKPAGADRGGKPSRPAFSRGDKPRGDKPAFARGDKPARPGKPFGERRERGDQTGERPSRGLGFAKRDGAPKRGGFAKRDGFTPRDRSADDAGERPAKRFPQRDGFAPREGAPKRDGFAKPVGGKSERKRGRPLLAEVKPAVWVPGPDARVISVEKGMDLAHFLVAQTKKRLSVRAARKALEGGACRINGRVETFGSRILALGDVVEFFLGDEREHRFDKRRLLLDDVGVLAYDKPPFLPVTPTDGPKSWSLTDILKAELGSEIYPVHRLDADTSGIVLFARNADLAKKLEELFKEHAVEKTYVALVRGHPPETGERRSYLVKVESRRGFEKWASGRGQDAREAITAWTVLDRVGKFASLVEVRPRTGRYHQIRIHFSEMDFPLYGDRLYGDRKDPIHCMHHMLHAVRVHLPHPAGGPALDIKAPLPAEFQEAMDQLRKL